MTEGQQRTLGAVAALAGIGWFFEKYWREALILWASVTAVLWILVYLRYRSLPLGRVWQRGRRIAEYAWVFVFWEVIALFFFLVAVFVEHRKVEDPGGGQQLTAELDLASDESRVGDDVG